VTARSVAALRRALAPTALLSGGLGVLGAVGVLWLVLSGPLHLALIVFMTGSMTPTAPTGSLAVSQTVAAGELRAGDIVTVPREGGEKVVTHRIVEIEHLPGGDARLLLQGDGNATPDALPDVVASAPRVVAVVPGAGTLVTSLREPQNLMILTLIAALVVGRAFWPSDDRGRPTWT
jgi:signal peptidase I